MNIQTTFATLFIVVCIMCVLISVMTEFIKDVGFLKKIPTRLLVLMLSIIVCVVSYFAYISYANIGFMWYYLVAVIFGSFIVAIITTNGWDYLIGIIKKFYRDSIDFDDK